MTQGGKDHSSHRLVFLGLTEKRAVLTLYGVATAFSVLAVGLRLFDVYLTVAVTGLAAVALAVFGVFLGEVSTSDDSGMARGGGDAAKLATSSVVLRAAIKNKREIVVLLADLMLVVGCFVLAHYLRFESGLPEEHARQMVALLPAVVMVKVATLYTLGAYRGILRYAGSHELIRVGKASTLASAILVVGVVLVFRFEGYSRSVFIIDWMLATMLLATFRGAFRGLRGYFSARRGGGQRIVLYGAEDAGVLALREVRQNSGRDLKPVGFIDDDPEKQGALVHGLPVLGTSSDLPEVCEEYDVDAVVIAISELPESSRERIIDMCGKLGVDCRILKFNLSPVD